MTTNFSRWTIAFAGAIALHGVALGMVPWSTTVALSERSAGEEADVWGAPSNTVMLEFATIEQVSGDDTETAEEVQEATTTKDVDPTEVTEVEPVVEEQQVAMAEPAAVEAVQETEPVEAPAVDEVAEVEPEKPIEAPREIAAIDPESPMKPVEDVSVTKLSEAVAIPQPKPREIKAVEPKPQPKKVAEAAPKPPTTKNVDQARKSTKTQKARGNAEVSVSAASGVARGNRGERQAEAGWANRSNYAGRIVAHLQKHKHYPKEAADKRLTGIAMLTFSISADGRLKSVSLRGSSGAAPLDQAALATVKRASPFPAIPQEAGVSSMTFTVPLRYRQQ